MSARVDRWRSRPRNFAIVLAACVAVACLVCWPTQTWWAIGGLVGAVGLSVGINLFLTKRRKPTATPELVRIHIDPNVRVDGNLTRAGLEDATEPQPADQAGDHPDTIRIARVRRTIETLRREYSQFGRPEERAACLAVTDDLVEVLDWQASPPAPTEGA